MIIEGLVTTRGPDGKPHLAPMGPEIAGFPFEELLLKPFGGSQTATNLRENRTGIFHATDDVLLLARAAIGVAAPPAETLLLDDYCWAVEFEITSMDTSAERWRMPARVTRRHTGRPWRGFNRAQFAVVEAAILATRIHLLPAEQLRTEFDRLAVLVQKTGGSAEHEAFAFLHKYVERGAKP